MLNFILNGLGITKKNLVAMSEREKLGDFLPWEAWDPKTKIWANMDDTIGFAWECRPVFFAGTSTLKSFEGLFRIDLPAGSIMQFILVADPHIEPQLEAYKRSKVRQNEVAQHTVDRLTDFLRESTKGLKQMAGIPVRRYRLFFTVKMPSSSVQKRNLIDIRDNIEEILRGASMAPESLSPSLLLDWVRRTLNVTPSGQSHVYDDNVAIRSQALWDYLETGFSSIKSMAEPGAEHARTFRCVTPRTLPREGFPLQTNMLFGGIFGQRSDGDQIKAPFWYTLNILVEDQKTRLRGKCALVLKQQAAGAFAPGLYRKKEEFTWAVDEIDRGTKFFQVIPTFWVYSDNESLCNEAVSRVKRLWEAQGYIMQEDKGILMPLMLSSLPFGLYNVDRNVSTIDRHYDMQVDAIPVIAPVQSDFAGFGEPKMLLVGRKGQICGLDVFDSKATNHNIFIGATSGGGKSFFVNYLVFNYFVSGAKIRIVDIGGSYKKMAKLFNARFMDFDPSSRICLNPFTNIKDPKYDVPVIAPIIGRMAYSTTDEEPTQTELQAIKNAVRWAYENEGTDADLRQVSHYLQNIRQYDDTATSKIEEIAKCLAYNLADFLPGGDYGDFFNGRANFDISSDDFVVLELERLKHLKGLFNVVTLLMVNATTLDMYLSDRSTPRFAIFDEAHLFLRNSGVMADVIEEGYRRARKYHASFSIITQSCTDLRKFGVVGDVINGSAAFKFLLESPDFAKAKQEKLIDYDDFVMDLLTNTLKSKKGHYSELFMDTPFGLGIGRLIVDPYSYYTFTSSGEEIAEIEGFVDGGMSYHEAILEMVRRYRSGDASKHDLLAA